MIIKFQIYSILHPIPSKGILESHTNVLLNRKRIFKFYFTIFFSGTGEREVPSTYLRNASVYPAPPTQSKRFAAEVTEVVSVPTEGPGSISPSMLFSPRVLRSNIFQREFLCVRTGGRGAGEVASGPDPTTNSAGDPTGQCLNLSGLSVPICHTRGWV